jgi:MFS family permease
MIAVGGVQDGWRWIFWINVPLCALVIAGVLACSRERADRRPVVCSWTPSASCCSRSRS